MVNDDKFWSNIEYVGECWLWRGSRNRNGAPAYWRFQKHYNPVKIIQMICGKQSPEKHAQRTIRCGNVLCVHPDHNLYPTTDQRFWSKVDIRPHDECWLWKGAAIGNNGYGRFYISSSISVPAHRYALTSRGVKVPSGMEILHTCDVPLCVNPSHLLIGTHKENMRDMSVKGRSARGENNPSSKLTYSQVHEIRKLFSKGGVAKAELARRYGVSATVVRHIIEYRIWK